MRIAGLDICKGYAVAWILDELPADPKQVWKHGFRSRFKKPSDDPYTFWFCHDVYRTQDGERVLDVRGIDTFLSWEVDAIALEPTGLHYSMFISKVCESHGIKVFWVNHHSCRNWRQTHGLPDKNDIADAYALCAYTQTFKDYWRYFIRFENGSIAKIRDLYHLRKFCIKMSVKASNRAQHHLAFDFPESASLYSDPVGKASDGRRPLLSVVAGHERGTRRSPWVNRLNNSIAREYGIELSDPSIYLAGLTDDFDLKVNEINSRLSELVYSPQFAGYNFVFDRFNFGVPLRGLLLTLIYPFSERFTGSSLPAFKRRIGLARVETQSGTSIKGSKTGSSSSICRAEFYCWVSSQFKLGAKTQYSEQLQRIKDYHDEKTAQLKADPEKLALQAAAKYQARLRSEMFNSLSSSGLMTVNQVKALLSEIDWSAKVPAGMAKNNLVGNLVINKTGGYAAKLLYRALDEVRETLDSAN
jgi:hypothetical protein